MNGKITISRVSTSHEDNYIKIRFEDNLSSTSFLEAKISLENFAKALTGYGYIPCDFELHPNYVGKMRENKTEIIPMANPYQITREEKEIALKEFEVDGWEGYKDDLDNHHRYTKDGIKVSFVRFVEVTK